MRGNDLPELLEPLRVSEEAMATSPPTRTGILLLGAVLGLVAFGLGLALAEAYLPEWREVAPRPQQVYRERFGEIAAQAGFVPVRDEPQVRLVTRSVSEYEPFRALGDEGTDWLLATHTGIRVEAFQEMRHPGVRTEGRLSVDFAMDARPQALGLTTRDFASLFRRHDPASDLRFATGVAPTLLGAGESLGPARVDTFGTSPRLMIPIAGSSPPQHLLVMISALGGIVGRRAGTVTDASLAVVENLFNRILGQLGWRVFAFLSVLGLFVGLAVKARLGMLNGAILALLCLVTLSPAPSPQIPWLVFILPAMGLTALWIFLAWSSAESLLRSTDANFTTSLDALRAGRLGPRGGRSLLTGFAFGAGLAGLGLALLSLAVALPGIWPEAASFNLPVFQPIRSPVVDGASLAAGVALILAFAMRVLPLRWAPLAAALVAGAALSPLAIRPVPAALVANALYAGLLVYVCRRHGLTALLTAAIVAQTLPLAVFTGLHLRWTPAGFAVTAGLPVAIVVLGLLGLSRSPAAEIERLAVPAFVRRLEEQRRLQHEMSLLARMQRGLLPRTLPQLAGWEVAAHSVLANEAGGDLYDFLLDDAGFLWLAAGDVAGHGYSCAIAQAMTKAALVSLIRTDRTPAQVLQRADAVLRAAGAARNFTSLALLRLDPASGEAVLSNAGHPPALLWAAGEVTEIAIPSLPLGWGPPRRYEDLALHLPAGAVLVFSSDGLFEALDGGSEQYGYERAQEVLRSAGSRHADKILEALLADWRRHLRGGAPLDDTTLVVLQRSGGPA
jgi:serine phosphatase RsbU (regulator of sigma subunit)